jgi:hypothetical protein
MSKVKKSKRRARVKSRFPDGRTLDGFSAEAYEDLAGYYEWSVKHAKEKRDYETPPFLYRHALELARHCCSVKMNCGRCMAGWLRARAEFARAREGGGA